MLGLSAVMLKVPRGVLNMHLWVVSVFRGRRNINTFLFRPASLRRRLVGSEKASKNVAQSAMGPASTMDSANTSQRAALSSASTATSDAKYIRTPSIIVTNAEEEGIKMYNRIQVSDHLAQISGTSNTTPSQGPYKSAAEFAASCEWECRERAASALTGGINEHEPPTTYIP